MRGRTATQARNRRNCTRMVRAISREASWIAGLILALVPALAAAQSPSPTPEPEEKLTAPPPPGGKRSIGTPPPPRIRPGAVETRERPSEVGLARQKDGSFLYVDPGRMFTMTVRPDGRVLFADRHRRASPGNAQHGKIGHKRGSPVLVPFNPIGGVPMRGPLEFLMQLSGHDLAANAKRAALRETEAFRTQLAVGWTKARVRKRLAELPAELLALWSDDGISASERRRILFDRWDECEDRLGVELDGIPPDAITEVDQVRRAAAENARDEIERFIRRHLASGNAGFTESELRKYNDRRVSIRTFDPYAAPAAPAGVDAPREPAETSPSDD